MSEQKVGRLNCHLSLVSAGTPFKSHREYNHLHNLQGSNHEVKSDLLYLLLLVQKGKHSNEEKKRETKESENIGQQT
jgi:hypothetical protein